MGIPRNGCKSSKSESPVMMHVDWSATARSRNLLSLTWWLARIAVGAFAARCPGWTVGEKSRVRIASDSDRTWGAPAPAQALTGCYRTGAEPGFPGLGDGLIGHGSVEQQETDEDIRVDGSAQASPSRRSVSRSGVSPLDWARVLRSLASSGKEVAFASASSSICTVTRYVPDRAPGPQQGAW